MSTAAGRQPCGGCHCGQRNQRARHRRSFRTFRGRACVGLSYSADGEKYHALLRRCSRVENPPLTVIRCSHRNALRRLRGHSAALGPAHTTALLFRLHRNCLVCCFSLQRHKRIRGLHDTQGSIIELDARHVAVEYLRSFRRPLCAISGDHTMPSGHDKGEGSILRVSRPEILSSRDSSRRTVSRSLSRYLPCPTA
jgi:hypothetical protein